MSPRPLSPAAKLATSKLSERLIGLALATPAIDAPAMLTALLHAYMTVALQAMEPREIERVLTEAIKVTREHAAASGEIVGTA